MLNNLLHLAKNTLSNMEQMVGSLPEPQVSVLATEKNVYIAKNDVEGSICNELVCQNDTKIVNILTMWKNGQVDLPSFAFRKAVLAMNSKNKDTDILLQSAEGFVVKKLSETME